MVLEELETVKSIAVRQSHRNPRLEEAGHRERELVPETAEKLHSAEKGTRTRKTDKSPGAARGAQGPRLKEVLIVEF